MRWPLLDAKAQALGAKTIGDLARHPDLRFGLSHEFLQRSDGWPGLKRTYGLPQSPDGLDHGLAYEAIAAGQIDVMDIYSTDAKIAKYKLRVLADDKHYFPEYAALFVYRLDVPQAVPESLGGARAARRPHRRAGDDRHERASGAGRQALRCYCRGLPRHAGQRDTGRLKAQGSWLALLFGPDFWRLTGQHLMLVFVSLAAAVAIGVPLGMWAARRPAAAQPILGSVSVIQTIPALALLAFLIPLLGMIGTVPALVALFLYSLLPIVRNTHSGLTDISPQMRESARALGLPARSAPAPGRAAAGIALDPRGCEDRRP